MAAWAANPRRAGAAAQAALGLALLAASPAQAGDAQAQAFRLEAGFAPARNVLMVERDGIGSRQFLQVETGKRFGPLRLHGAVGLHGDARDPSVLRFDGTHALLDFGEIEFGAGLIPRNWSLSNETSLVLSRNARPFPAVHVARRSDQPVDLPLLRLMGPWRFEVLLGQLEQNRAVPNALVFGARSSIEPLPGLELGVVRTAQWGGKGRPQGWRAFMQMLRGNTNINPRRSLDQDAANQLAGFDFGYRLPEHVAPLRVYGQVIGEDEQDRMPVKLMYLLGAEWSPTIAGVPSRFTLEWLDTRANQSGLPAAGLAYRSNVYLSGYTHRGRVMGPSADGDAVVTRLYGAHDLGGLSLDWGLGHYVINAGDRPVYRLSTGRAEGLLAHLGLGAQWNGARLSGAIVYQGFALDKVEDDARLTLSVGLSMEF